MVETAPKPREALGKGIEVEPVEHFDAILVHSYWLSRQHYDVRSDGHGGIVIPKTFERMVGSLRTRLAVRAAALETGDSTFIVVAAGNLRGPQYRASSGIMKKELVGRYGISGDRVIATSEAYGTESEAQVFRRLAREHGWKNVAVIAFGTHYRSVERFLPEGEVDGLSVTHRSVEDIIQEEDDERVWDLVERLRDSRYALGFKAYELVKSLGMSIPGVKDRAYQQSKKTRSAGDSFAQNLISHAIDVFRS